MGPAAFVLRGFSFARMIKATGPSGPVACIHTIATIPQITTTSVATPPAAYFAAERDLGSEGTELPNERCSCSRTTIAPKAVGDR